MRFTKSLASGFAASSLALFSLAALAQPYPANSVRIISPFPPGGGNDTVARFLAAKLPEQMGGNFVVENRAGSAGLIGADTAAKSAPDGYTRLVTSPEFAINPNMRAKMPYDTFKDFAFISQLTSGQFMLSCHPSLPAKTLQDVLALARARPGQINYASSGSGGINHLAGELLQSMTGIRWTHVPYKGAAPAVVATMSGETECAFTSTTGAVAHVKAGRLRAIALTGNRRFTELANVPTMAEAGVAGYSVTG
ncbi:MAG: tripartite tricarboxylate transporter substrate binding protein [Betaproteobacteria bacterium]|nr:tripartite tricarboxylate transporter substrate binding protein [Betaproteobacteria bacterium]